MNFTHAYTAAPMCNPARVAILFGQSPDTSKVYDHEDASDAALAEVTAGSPSLFDTFWSAGYATYSSGKVGPAANTRSAESRRHEIVTEDDWISPYDGEPVDEKGYGRGPIDFGPSGLELDEEDDVQTAQWAADRIRTTETPFLLAYGTVRPHVPLRVPQRFFDEHPLDEVVLPEILENDYDDLSDYARTDIAQFHPQFEEIRDAGLWAEVVRAYQASTSYADYCIGIVLDALADSPHGDDTVVLVFSDHGYHIGEKLDVHKFTLWEEATRVPFLLRAPGVEPSEFDRPVSTMDLGPTAAGLAGLEITWPHEGIDLVPALDDPSIADDNPPIMTWLEGNHAVRWRNWRYIRYRTGNVELYDHDTDPNEFENLAGRSEFADVEAQLHGYLRAN